MKKILLFALLPLTCLAQIPEYYSSIDFTLSGNPLKDELAELITETHTIQLVYTPDVWNALRQTDLDPDDSENVLLVYGYDDSSNDVSIHRSRSKYSTCHSSSCSGLWVREHVFPRSLGNPNLEFEGPGSDAHHLRSIDNAMNSRRSNRVFTTGNGHATTLPGDTFYPGDEWKGDVARMMMYMYVRYGAQCQATSVGAGSSSYSYYDDMPNIFLEWNEQDPVSVYEINRNNILEELQGNRNPFIDNPYLATKIWNGPTAQDSWGVLHSNENALDNVFIYPAVTSGIVHIQNNTSAVLNCKIYNTMGQSITSTNTNTPDLTGNAAGVYFLTLSNGSATKTFRIIKQ